MITFNTVQQAIYDNAYTTYTSPNFTTDCLHHFLKEYETQIELALECYYRFEDEERDSEIIQSAWNMYDTLRYYTWPVIKAIKDVLSERGKR